MQKTVTILEVEERKGAKSGKLYRVAQCIVHGEKKRVGELMIFNSDIKCFEGEFVAHFDVTVNFERQVAAELVGLTPVKPGVVAPTPKAA